MSEDEIAGLQAEYDVETPPSQATRRRLAGSLVDPLHDTEAEEVFQTDSTYRDRVWELYQDHPDDGEIRRRAADAALTTVSLASTPVSELAARALSARAPARGVTRCGRRARARASSRRLAR